MKNVLRIIALFGHTILTIHGTAKQFPAQIERLGYGADTIPAHTGDSLLLMFPELPVTGDTDRQVLNMIIFGVDYRCTSFVADTTIALQLLYKYYDKDDQLIDSATVTMNVIHTNSGGATNDHEVLMLKGGYKVELKLLSVNGNSSAFLPKNMFVETRIMVERFSDFSEDAADPIDIELMSISSVDVDCVGAEADEYLVAWPEVETAEEYDLEWFFINDYDFDEENMVGSTLPWTALEVDFSNASRISTSALNYSIVNIFDRGVLVVRVRPVGRLVSDPSVPVYGTWSYGDRFFLDASYEADLGNTIFETEAHEGDLNWQLTSTFAENGKRKDVISYFDGSLRNRQTVTRLNTQGVAVVGETIYDFAGRPAIQVLPAPVVSQECLTGIPLSGIEYYPDFNLFDVNPDPEITENFALHASHFDWVLEDPCAVSNVPLETISGASHYYSPSNEIAQFENAFIPDANEYPYSRTTYTPDNTGRVALQGGVGPEFQPGGEHDTRYLYATPYQLELDRLFGSEAGNADHYKKNAVIDPNGQISVSYLDMMDRVIATALIGEGPENLVRLEDNGIEPYTDSEILTVDLFNTDANGQSLSNVVDPDSTGMNFITTVLVPVPTDYILDYSLDITPFTYECVPDLCLLCAYQLTIEVFDECGNVLVSEPEMPQQANVGFFTTVEGAIQFSTDCELSGSLPYTDHLELSFTEPGVYTIVKRLEVYQGAIDLYLEELLASDTEECIYTFEEFLAEQENLIDEEDCAIELDCASCLEDLGDRGEYIATGNGTQAENALRYDWLYTECMRLCQPLSECKVNYLMMCADVYPSGQYGETELVGNFSPSAFPLSVYNEENALPLNAGAGNGNWRYPAIELNGVTYEKYLDSEGFESFVPLTLVDGAYVPAVVDNELVFLAGGQFLTTPQNLTNLEDFLANWTNSWSQSLVQLHPEWCYYEACREYSEFQSSLDYLTSDQFDEILRTTETFDEAVQLGLVVQNVGTPSNPFDLGDWLLTDWLATHDVFELGDLGTAPFSSDDDVIYDSFHVFGREVGQEYAGINAPYFGSQLADQFANDVLGSELGLEKLCAGMITCQVDPTLGGCTTPDADDYGIELGDTPEEIEANLDNLWTMTRDLYLQMKSQLQYERNTEYVIHTCPGYNGCIGELGYGSHAADFLASSGLAIYEEQPCYPENALLYINKTPRFIHAEQVLEPFEDTQSMLGQCDNEMYLQAWLSAMAAEGELDGTAYDLIQVPVFAMTLCNAAYVDPPMDLSSTWNATVTTNELHIDILEDSTRYCGIELVGPQDLATWDDVIQMSNLHHTITPGEFTLDLYYTDTTGTPVMTQITGTTDCLDLECTLPTTADDCQPTSLFHDLVQLMMELLDNDDFLTTIPELEPAQEYPTWMTPAIVEAMGLDYDPEQTVWVASDTFIGLKDLSQDPVREVGFNIENLDPGDEELISEIVDIECSEEACSLWVMLDGVLTELEATPTEGLTYCHCFDLPIDCCEGEEFDNFSYVEEFISEFMIHLEDGMTTIPLYSTPSLTPELLVQFGQGEVDHTFNPTYTYSGNHAELLVVSGVACDLEIILINDPNSTEENMSDVTSVSNFTLYGEPDAAGNYFQFTFQGSVGVTTVTFIGSWCVPLQVCPEVPPCLSIPPIPVEIVEDPEVDPCIVSLYANATENAYTAYEQYLVDMTSDVTGQARAHCLSALTETFTASFLDQEYHYTLYYYDQAGNLVRTVPPAGVQRLEIMNSTDSVSVRINEDRTNNQRRVFTFHSLATTYTYNSLNQLVRQNIPDHDLMDIQDTEQPFGLHPEFETEEYFFHNAANGWATGTVETTNADRGYLYRSQEGGLAWQQVNGLVASDIRKIRMINSTLGLAVGNDGAILRTRDGGNTWDMLNSTAAFGSQLPTRFNDVAFSAAVGSTSTSVHAVAVGDNGLIVRVSGLYNFQPTVTRMSTLTIANPTNFPTLDNTWNFNTIESSLNFSWVITASVPNGFDGERFTIFVTASPTGFTGSSASLTIDQYMVPQECTCVAEYMDGSTRKKFMGGVNGSLFHCDNVSSDAPTWYQVPGSFLGNFEQLHFVDRTTGVAIANTGGESRLFKTTDSGRNWEAISPAGVDIKDLFVYDNHPECITYNIDLAGHRALVSGENGHIARLTILGGTSSSIAYDVLSSPSGEMDIHAVWAAVTRPCTQGLYAETIIAGGTDGNLYIARTGLFDNQPDWQFISPENLTEDIVDIQIQHFDIEGNGMYDALNGLLLTENAGIGTLFNFYYSGEVPDCSDPNSDTFDCNTENPYWCLYPCPEEYIVTEIEPDPAIDFDRIMAGVSANTNGKLRIWAMSQEVGTQTPLPLYDVTLHRLDVDETAPVTTLTDLEIVPHSESRPVYGIRMNGFFTSSISGDDRERISFLGGFGFMSQILAGETPAEVVANSANSNVKFRPLEIESTDGPNPAVNTHRIMGVGKSGVLAVRKNANSSGSGYWLLANSGTKEDLHCIDHASTTEGFIVGDNGTLIRFDPTDVSPQVNFSPNAGTHVYSPTIAITVLNSTTTSDLTSVTANSASGTVTAYVFGDDGTALFSSSMGTPSFSEGSGTNQAVWASDILPGSTKALFAGTEARFGIQQGTSSLANPNVFIPAARDVHFSSASEGLVIASWHTVRHTSDGGQHWEVVSPSESFGANEPELYKVWSNGTGSGYVVGHWGNDPFFARISNNILYKESFTQIAPIVDSYTIRDVIVDPDGIAWAVGGKTISPSTHSGIIFKRDPISGVWAEQPGSAGTTTLYAMHRFPSNGAIIACGSRGVINTWFDGNWILTASAIGTNELPITMSLYDFHDIYFHDDLVGYVVGTDGMLLKTEEAGTCPLNYDYLGTGLIEPATSLAFRQKAVNDGINGQSTASNISLRTIAFPIRSEGLYGGSYTTTPEGFNRYVWDDSFMISTRFWYDKLGRLVMSQNSKQYNLGENEPKRFSYTLYDALGRIQEVGEKIDNNGVGELKQEEIFGEYIEGFYNPRVLNDDDFVQWIGESGVRNQVTSTYYDEDVLASELPEEVEQENLRKRVASVTYEEVWDDDETTYEHATHYSYDIHGNVNTLVQDYPEIGLIDEDQRFKRLDYTYDLISGNVNQVSYQAGKTDQMYHRYTYDADNRIVDVYTSAYGWSEGIEENLDIPLDFAGWEKDATYRYYLHGPLARVELGDIQVQGLDYAYTLQGWIKGVNSNSLLPGEDMGKDGVFETANALFGTDAFGFTLGYYTGDYASIAASSFLSGTDGSELEASREDLWNGNIGSMVTSLYAPYGSDGDNDDPLGNVLVQGMAYRYDQLNRLTKAVALDNYTPSGNDRWAASGATENRYLNTFTYDPNGNILSQHRYDEAGTLFDQMEYRYFTTNCMVHEVAEELVEGEPELTQDEVYRDILMQNRLYHVNDDTDLTALKDDDIDDQGTFDGSTGNIRTANNYRYDALGQLVADDQEEISVIDWRVDGKIRTISRPDESDKKELSFEYDAMGQRVAKKVYDAEGTWEETTYYIRDAQGNVMSVYTHTTDGMSASLTLDEQHLYGSSRLGMRLPGGVQMIGATDPDPLDQLEVVRGLKRYELANHLGNVLSVITDRKLAVEENEEVDYYLPDVVSYSDYYPFGAPMDNGNSADDRTWSGNYRYGFNGKELDRDGMGGGGSTYDYGFRLYNSQLGKFLSVDPLLNEFAFYSPYHFAGNRPSVAVDLDGREDVWTHSWVNEDGSTNSITMYRGDEEYERRIQDLKQQLGLHSVPETGAFVTHQVWNDDGTFTLRTSYTPQVTIDGKNLFDILSSKYSEWVTNRILWVDQKSAPDNGYELDGIEGLREYSSEIGTIGRRMQYAGGPMAVVGRGLEMASLAIDTSADFYELDQENAFENLGIRIGVGLLERRIAKSIKGPERFGTTPIISEGAAATEEILIEENNKKY